MRQHRLQQVIGASVVHKEQALSSAPQGRGSELIRPRCSLIDAISEPRPHVMQREIRIRMIGHVAHAGVD
jgi:hypothetical protein